MKEFAETLREINDRLDLPQPARSRVLLEIAADLRDLFEHFRAQGLSSKEARRLALERCDLTDDVLTELVRIHASAWRRFLDRFSAQAKTRWERSLLVLLLVFVAAVAGQIVLTADVFRAATPWVWPALVVTCAAVAFSGPKFYLAYLKKDHNPRRLRSGLTAILVAGGVDLLIGAYGNWLGLYRVARRTADDIAGFWLFLAEWLVESSSLMVVCFTAAILTALLWYVLTNKLAHIERAEAAALLAGE